MSLHVLTEYYRYLYTTTMNIIITHYHSHASFLSSLSCLQLHSPEKQVAKKTAGRQVWEAGKLLHRSFRTFVWENHIPHIPFSQSLVVQGYHRISTSLNSNDASTHHSSPRFGGEHRNATFSPPHLFSTQKKGENPYDWNPCRSRGHNLTLYTSTYFNHGGVIHQQQGFVTFYRACHDIEGIGHGTAGLFQKCLNELTQILMDILCPNTF